MGTLILSSLQEDLVNSWPCCYLFFFWQLNHSVFKGNGRKLKPVFVGIYGASVVPAFVGWCWILSIHSMDVDILCQRLASLLKNKCAKKWISWVIGFG